MRRARWRAVRAQYLPSVLLLLGTGVVLWYIGSLPYSPVEAVLVVLLTTTVLLLVHFALTRTGRAVRPAYWVSSPRLESAPPAAMDYRLLRLRRDLRDALERDDRPDDIYPVVRGLAAERLRAHHDIDLDTQPEQAQRVAAPGLWAYLSTPPTDTRKRSRSALHTAIEGIEKL